MDLPPADPRKLLASWMEWEKGETTPGRVMADLKTGGLRQVLEHLAPAAAAQTPGAHAGPRGRARDAAPGRTSGHSPAAEGPTG